jgi:hypothetical protein
VAALSQILVV